MLRKSPPHFRMLAGSRRLSAIVEDKKIKNKKMASRLRWYTSRKAFDRLHLTHSRKKRSKADHSQRENMAGCLAKQEHLAVKNETIS